MSARVVVLTKDPTPGRVKTRLAATLGAEGAARLHAAFAQATVRRAARSGLPVTVSLRGDLQGPFARALAALGAGLETQADGDLGAGGNTHDLYVQAGLPLELGPVSLVPELGYRFMQFDFDSVLSDQPANVTFLSTTTHLATMGARATYFPVQTWMLELDGGALLGHTAEGPRQLGDGGFTVGGYGRLGAQVFLNDVMGLSLRYQVDYRRASYSGASQLDPAITEGTLSGFTQGLYLGLSFLLAG